MADSTPGTAPKRTAQPATPVNPYAGALGLIWILALIAGAVVSLWALSAGSESGLGWGVVLLGVAALTGLFHLAVNAIRWQPK
jgi:hypothetical protein